MKSTTAMRLTAVAALVTVAATLGGCASTGAPGSADPAESGQIVATISGELGDQSFFDSAGRGIERAADELGTEIKIVESSTTDAPAWDRNLREASRRSDVSLIVTGGVIIASTLEKVAAEFPDKRYILFDSESVGDNVTGITYASNEGAFLAGVLSALVTSNPDEFPLASGSKRIGLVGGVDIPVAHDFIAGFEQGVEAVDPTIIVDVRYTGDFVSPQKGFDTATALLDEGADVLYHFAGTTGLGVLEAAAKSGKYALGSDSDQAPLYPENIVGSVIKSVDNTVYDAIMAAQAGELKFGETLVGSLANDGMGFAYNDALVPIDVRDIVEGYRTRIVNGDIVVAAGS